MRFALVAVALVASLGSLAAADPVPGLIEDLANPDYHRREAASRALDAIGEPALEALIKAAKSHPDPEALRRAGELAARIAKKVDDEKTLAPTLVQLDCEGEQLTDVLDRLEKQTGYKVKLQDQLIGQRKVTVSTKGKIAYWVLMEKICESAGLEIAANAEIVEYRNQPRLAVDPVQPPERMPKRNSTGPVVSDSIVLRAQSGERRPSFVRGAVRITCVPLSHAMSAKYPKNEIPVILSVQAEPKLKLERVVSIGILKAIDESGRELVALSSASSDPAITQVAVVRNGNIVVNGAVFVPARGTEIMPSPGFYAHPTQGLARLKVGPEPTEILTTFAGVVRGSVRTGPEELAVVTGLDTAKNPAPARGPNAVLLSASHFTAKPDQPELYELDIAVSYPPSEVQIADASGLPYAQETVIVQGGGRVIIRRQMGGSSYPDRGRFSAQIAGLAALDAAGRAFQVSAISYRRQVDVDGRATDSLKLAIKPSEKSVGKPTSVSFTATRAKSVDVPFELTAVGVAAGLGPIELRTK